MNQPNETPHPNTAGPGQHRSEPHLSPAITLVLVDDHELFRGGLRQLFTEHGLEIVGEANSGEAAVELVAATAPVVVVMDINMPGIGGIEAARRIAADSPATGVLMVTVSAEVADVSEAVMAGANGYVLKEAPADEIIAAVEAVARGESLLSARIAAGILQRIRAGEHLAATRDNPELLTERERIILALVADGLENGQIAEELTISVQTVKNHVSNILAKLHVENRVQAAVHAVRRGLLTR